MSEKELLGYITNDIFLNSLNESMDEGFQATLTHDDEPEMFKQMNDYMFGDKTEKEKANIAKKYTNKTKYTGKNGNTTQKDITPEIKGSIFAFGNAKLSMSCLIINLTSALNCPAKAKFCPIGEKACYAIKDEVRLTNTRARNVRSEMMFDMARQNPSKWRHIQWFIEQYIEKARNNGLEVNYVRLNEAGDFKTKYDILEFDKIAKNLKEKYGVITHAYTANDALKDYIAQVENMVINASTKNIEGNNVYRHFYGVTEKTLTELPNTSLSGIAKPMLQYSRDYGWYYKCPCDIAEGQKCVNCKVCWYASPGTTPNGEEIGKYTVLCKIHGPSAFNFDETEADKKRGIQKESIENATFVDLETQKQNILKMQQIARQAEREGCVEDKVNEIKSF